MKSPARKRSTVIGLLLGLLALASAAYLQRSRPPATEPRRHAVVASPHVAPPREAPAAVDLELEVDATDAAGRREISASPPAPAEARAAPPPAPRELVRVLGQVRRNGRPVVDYDLSFERSGPRPDEEDWDSTDEDGRYEVELPAARYDVWNDGGGPWLTTLVVLPQEREVVLDIDLPSER